MTISQTAEYALRSIMWLASQPTDAPLGTAQIAAATKVPAGYLSKVLQALGRAGLVVSAPGRTGGFKLARSPDDISVLDVINSVDPVKRIKRCPLGIAEHGPTLCPLHRRLDQAIVIVEKALSESKISELLRESLGARPLCQENPEPRPVALQLSGALAERSPTR